MIVSVILGTLAALAIPRLNGAIYKAQIARATGDIKAIEIELYDFWADNGRLPDSLDEIGRGNTLDPWGHPYQYARIAGNLGNGNGGKGANGETFRKDRFLKPLNSDFDLYSMGADGATKATLSASASQDDIVRANDGGFIGLGAEY